MRRATCASSSGTDTTPAVRPSPAGRRRRVWMQAMPHTRLSPTPSVSATGDRCRRSRSARQDRGIRRERRAGRKSTPPIRFAKDAGQKILHQARPRCGRVFRSQAGKILRSRVAAARKPARLRSHARWCLRRETTPRRVLPSRNGRSRRERPTSNMSAECKVADTALPTTCRYRPMTNAPHTDWHGRGCRRPKTGKTETAASFRKQAAPPMQRPRSMSTEGGCFCLSRRSRLAI